MKHTYNATLFLTATSQHILLPLVYWLESQLGDKMLKTLGGIVGPGCFNGATM